MIDAIQAELSTQPSRYHCGFDAAQLRGCVKVLERSLQRILPFACWVFARLLWSTYCFELREHRPPSWKRWKRPSNDGSAHHDEGNFTYECMYTYFALVSDHFSSVALTVAHYYPALHPWETLEGSASQKGDIIELMLARTRWVPDIEVLLQEHIVDPAAATLTGACPYSISELLAISEGIDDASGSMTRFVEIASRIAGVSRQTRTRPGKPARDFADLLHSLVELRVAYM
jgi:hypothetical protein